MEPDTGAIAHFETEEDARLAGYTEQLVEKEARLLMTMNRKERRARLAELRQAARRAERKAARERRQK